MGPPRSERRLRVGIDTGGTFTDVVAVDEATGEVFTTKTPSTPSDPSVGVLVAEHGGRRAVASAFAWYQTAKTVAGAAGKALAGVLLTLTASNFSLVFLIASLLSALPLLVISGLVHETSGPKDVMDPAEAKTPLSGDDQDLPPSGHTAGRPVVGPFVGLGFLFTGTAEMLHGLFPLLATKYVGLSEAEAAQLAASLPKPTSWHPGVGSPAYQRYVATIQRRMAKAEFLWKQI